MKKKILIVFLSLIAFIVTGCQSVVARRDQSQIVEFNNGLSRGEYILKAYKLDYPKTVEEKDLFFDNLNILMGKMIAHKKDLNIIIPYELYQYLSAHNSLVCLQDICGNTADDLQLY